MSQPLRKGWPAEREGCLAFPYTFFCCSDRLNSNKIMVNLNINQVLTDPRSVSHIRVVVHAGPATDESDNHWSLYLLLRAGGSVRVNMVTNYGEIDGRLEWSYLEYLLTNSAIRYWDFPVRMAIQVQHVADTIYRNSRHQYQFSGCEYGST